MNILKFDIYPSPGSNDHQLRIIIDGIDWLGERYLGLDPPEFFRQKALFENGRLLIGRCECGCIGCDDVSVEVIFSGNEVIWTTERESKLSFAKENYLKTIRDASTDFSWEDLNRRVERLVSEIFDGKLTENNLLFDWASTRIEPNVIKLSFGGYRMQKLYDFNWDGKTIDSALENARLFYRKNFKEG